MKRRQPEKEIQQQILTLLELRGADVWVLGTRRPQRCPYCRKVLPSNYQSTRQTPGLQDLQAILPPPPGRPLDPSCLLIVEVKSPNGRLSRDQQHFRQRCLDANVEHVAGGLEQVIEWLIAHGYLLEEQVSHETTERIANG